MSDDSQKSEVAKREEGLLKFWQEQDIFKKTLAKPSPKGEFIFYEGPPTANGRPGIHHLATRAFKDAILRFRTMQGYHVRRKAGWDTHGLPVELEVEKELGIKNKKDIEAYGIAKFNKKCKESVLRYIDEWKRFTNRIGFWVDHDDTYFTFDNDYIESVWAILKKADARGLLYKDYKVVPWCSRCGTALSSHEVAQGYDETRDPSVYVKFRLISPVGNPLDLNKANEHEYMLVWTTTPWTLPGNVALAVWEDVTYVKAETEWGSVWIAKERLSAVLPNGKVLAEAKGGELIGKKYEPLFSFLKNSAPDNQQVAFEKAYTVYPAGFVSTEDGTGIVHVAVMYGADDFELGTKLGLPKHHLVSEDGTFSKDAGPLAGRFVKDADKDVIADLQSRELLFKQETIEHTYPFCWRCKTPLLYYARDSWYIRMSELKDDLVRENREIHWEPEHIRDGRFGEWLKELKDWAISRSRYWGTPLPIWEAKDGTRLVIGSERELVSRAKHGKNTYFVMRHGEAQKNIDDRFDCTGDPHNHLTEKGRMIVEQSARVLKTKAHIDLIITSPLVRAQETAAIVQKTFGLPDTARITEQRFVEVQVGVFDGKTITEWRKFFSSPVEKFSRAPEGGETYMDVRRRVGEALLEIDRRYSGKSILFVMHDTPAWLLAHVASGRTVDVLMHDEELEDVFLDMGVAQECPFIPVPRDENFEPDFHRPYIDTVVLTDDSGKEYRRVPEVLDVWFDSGAMPLAQDHYPFYPKAEQARFGAGTSGLFKRLFGTIPARYPADFICEAIDQTRGWFYTLHAVGGIMKFGKAFKNVICLGHVLDAKGKKMSKSLGNVVDPNAMITKYGADALRYFMYTVNAPGDPKNFEERAVSDIVKKHIGRLANVLAFYKLYEENVPRGTGSVHVLDRWILARLNKLIEETTAEYENYKLDAAVRPLADFIDDFSTWYIRRSRDRLKSVEKHEALQTLRHVLYTIACVMAPAMPFFAEHIFQDVKENTDPESVHLMKWPDSKADNDEERLASMQAARNFVSQALEARDKAGIKVRQPLSRLDIPAGLIAVDVAGTLKTIAAEVNVKHVVESTSFALDTTVTPELKEEGIVREFIRRVQDARKNAKMHPRDKVSIVYGVSDEESRVISMYEKDILSVTNAVRLERGDVDGVVVQRT